MLLIIYPFSLHPVRSQPPDHLYQITVQKIIIVPRDPIRMCEDDDIWEKVVVIDNVDLGALQMDHRQHIQMAVSKSGNSCLVTNSNARRINDQHTLQLATRRQGNGGQSSRYSSHSPETRVFTPDTLYPLRLPLPVQDHQKTAKENIEVDSPPSPISTRSASIACNRAPLALPTALGSAPHQNVTDFIR